MSYAEPRRRRDRRIALLLACAAPIALAMPGAAAAQSESAEQTFAIPAGSLSAALQSFSAASGIQLVYASSLVEGLDSPGVNGRMTPAEALARLLAGTGLSGSLSGNTATIRSAGATADGELVTGVVSVEGYQGSPYFGGAGVAAGVNGINGSRDITATEGTGSFTSGALTIGSKVPQAMKDVPQTVSVLTNERLKQQNVTDLTSAMRQLPGVTLVQGASSLETTFYSRGFPITSIQVDGGVPLITASSNITPVGYFPQIDLAQYDHVELLRGATGTFTGFGNPSGSVNLVRKKPLDHGQAQVEAQAGSWDNYRLMIDLASPLAFDGNLRGRLVTTYQNRHYFYDTAKDDRISIYGVADLDVTPTTLLTAGASYTKQDSVPWQNGLPRYQDGSPLPLPRSTSIVFPWNRWNFETTELFANLEQKIGSDWTAKLDFTQVRQTSTQKVGYNTGAYYPPADGGPTLAASYSDFASLQTSIEATVTGAFMLFGQRQEVALGYNRANTDSSGFVSYLSPISTYRNNYQPYPGGPVYCIDYGAGYCAPGSIAASGPPIDLFAFNPDDPLYSEPRNPLRATRYSFYQQIQSGAYFNLRLTPIDRVHLMLGMRWSREWAHLTSEQFCTSIPLSEPTYAPNCYGREIGDVYETGDSEVKDTRRAWPPSASLSFDVSKSLTAYVGYSDIYELQSYYYSSDRTPLSPVKGSNVEAGIKWAPRDGRFNVSFSAYRVSKYGFGMQDTSVPFEQVAPGSYCCFLSNPEFTLRSEGIDLEATGEISRGWQVAASYNYGETKQKGSTFGATEGEPFLSIQPKHAYRLWTSYDFGAGGAHGALSGLTLSGGLNGQSSGYVSGAVCRNLTEPDPLSGLAACVSYDEPDYVLFDFTVPAYIVLSGRIDYRISPVWSLSVNLENILDKTYFQTVGNDPSQGNWYGAPRSVTASLRAKW